MCAPKIFSYFWRMIPSMKYKWIFVAVLSLCQISGFARVVVSRATGEPVVYASVGIVNRNLGTVTDSLGRFSLKVPVEYMDDSIRISSVGYVAQTFSVHDFRDMPDTVRLGDDVHILSEVVVKPRKIEHKTAGRKSSGGFIFIEVESDRAAGQGLAVPLTVNERVWLRGLGFTVEVNERTLSAMTFRVNVYVKEGSDYTPLASVRPVYFDYNKSDLVDGHFRYTFPEEIMLEKGKYYVELEFLKNFVPEQFIMKTHPMTGKTRYRYASQSGWETLPFGAPLYIEYDRLR